MGNAISHNVELSGRPSSHVNILDALDAVDLIMQSHSTTSFVTPMPQTADATDGIMASKEQLSDNYCNMASRIDSNSDTSMGACPDKIISPWESLAELAFGPNWFIEGKKREEHNQKRLASTTNEFNPFQHPVDGSLSDKAAAATAPQFAIGTADKSNERYKEMNGVEHPPQQCWYAPYVDVVPYYPIMQKVKRIGSIPLNLRNELHQQQQQQQHLDISLSRREKMEVQSRVAEARIDCTLRSIPDTKYWGVPPSIFESNMNGEKEQHDDNKMDDDNTTTKGADTPPNDSRDNNKIYPFFLPPLPPAYTYKFSSSSATNFEGTQLAVGKKTSTVTDPSQGGSIIATTTSSSSLLHDEELLKDSNVRSSLVKFSDDDGDSDNHNYYWGSRKRRKVMDDHRPMVVPRGLTTNGNGASTCTTNAALQQAIRPSSNRASRILEGSMDTS